ncbi:MAG TPA: DUF4412 domain-containing protein [Chitinophagales bacterium]|nr:DUF4412 domain-containing protein [Chitinophagales bacterium]
MKRLFLTFICATIVSANLWAQGFYIEYRITSSSNTMSGSMKTYAQDGNTRTEMAFSMSGPQAQQGINHNSVSLILKSTPDKIYTLDVDKKTYSELDISKKEDFKDVNTDDYEITVVGKEKVNGYNATHVIVKSKKTGMTIDYWNSTEIPFYGEAENIKSKYTGHDNLIKAMKAKGAEGFPVRIKEGEKGMTMQVDLVKAEKRSNPDSLFSLSGYTLTSTHSVGGGAYNQQEMMKKLQNMTPEERQKFIEQMKQQYQQQPH